ncbi:urease accessory protein UreD [Bosea sp. 117]|uniref:urease accessory protein UreD n=1 Tax=Bosea sp. 117 TaxID=1125973 RepID=UPI000A82F1CA|nr:urease accessory protein UreD [Bosea sp. 117]
MGPSAAGRRRAAELVFAQGGGRSALIRQIAPYPFHITRPFALDAERADLATLYLQSASGGIYRGDELSLRIDVRDGALAHVTSQAATVVHDTGARPASQHTVLRLGREAFTALTLDPLILFPGAELDTRTEIHLAEGACAIFAEGVAWHDYSGEGRPFGRLSSETLVFDGGDRTAVIDRATITGAELAGAASILGAGAGAFGSALLLGPTERLPEAAAIEDMLDRTGCLGGACAAPNDMGISVRMIAPNGGQIVRAVEGLFSLGVERMLGFEPARRRK